MFKDKPDPIAYYHDLREAFARPGCPFCRQLDQAANSQLDSMLWEMVNAPFVQETVQLARGFCHRHGWLLVRGGAALGITILVKSVFDTLLEVLDQTDAPAGGRPLRQLRHALRLPGSRAGHLASGLAPQQDCPICIALKPIEAGYTSTFLNHLTGSEEPLAPHYRQSDGLCLSHFRSVVEAAGPGQTLTELVSVQREIWQRLEAQLAEFIRKNDYRFAHEPVGEEGDAWRRALELLIGPPSKPGERSGGLTASLPRK